MNDMQVGEVRPISRNRCVLRTEDRLVAFGRYCPHEGADLANAAYVDGKLRCPWHNLAFDVCDGQQPCESLKDLKLYPLEAVGEGAYRLAGEGTNENSPAQARAPVESIIS